MGVHREIEEIREGILLPDLPDLPVGVAINDHRAAACRSHAKLQPWRQARAYSSGSGMSSRFGPPSRSSRRRSSGRGFGAAGDDRVEQVDAAGLEARLAGAREVASGALGIGGRRAGPRRSAGPARCRPSRRCRRSTTPRCAAAARRPAAGPRRRPAARTAASRRGACRRCARSRSSAPKNDDPHRHVREVAVAERRRRDRASGRASGRSPSARTSRSIAGTARLSSGTHSSLS